MKQTVVPLGPFHPLLEEAEHYKLVCEGERVVDVDLQVGYMHRGIEKLSESKTWDQVPFLVERICGICSTSHPIAYVNAVEDLLHLEIPDRAKFIRTFICEMERIHSHLLWVGLAGHFIGYDTVFMWGWKYREPILDVFEIVSGNRNHYAMMRVGGVRRDMNPEDFPAIHRILDNTIAATEMLLGAVLDDPVIHARTKGVGILTPEDALGYGTTGPTVRASGLGDDIRTDDPYAAYEQLEWKVCTWDSCDVFAKAAVRLLEITEACKISKQVLDKMPQGPISVEVRTFPVGEGLGHAEAPRGEVFHFVKSNGGNKPIRHKVRAPSHVNIPSYKATCQGERISDVALISAAVDPCYCCTERMSVVQKGSDRAVLTGEDLVRMSQEETRKIHSQLGQTTPIDRLGEKLGLRKK